MTAVINLFYLFLRMKNKNLAKTQDELRGTRSRSRTPTQVLGTLLRNTSLINSSNDLTNTVQNESSLARGASLRIVNLTNDSTNAKSNQIVTIRIMKSQLSKESQIELSLQEKRKKKKLGIISKKLILQRIVASFVKVKT